MSGGPALDPKTDKPAQPMTPWRWLREKTSLTHYIILAMGLGLLIGGVCGKDVVKLGNIFSTIFLRSVKALIVPLIASTLIVGIAGHGDDLGRVGRMFVKGIVYFEIVTTFALFLGLAAANIVSPGTGVNLKVEGKLDDAILKNTQNITIEKEVEKIFPDSFFAVAASNETLGVVMFSIAFACSLLWAKREHRRVFVNWCAAVSDIMFQFTWLVMCLAPLGILGALMSVIGKNGFGVLVNLGQLVGTLYVTLIIFVLVVLIPVLLFCRINLMEFGKYLYRPAMLAFFTASSESALPMAMELMAEFGVPKDIVSFVLPLGYSFNLDGTTLYLALAARFAAQAGGVEQSFGTQLFMMVSLMLVSKGVAAVPRASLVILASTCAQFNLPTEAILVILGVDAFMDMARTAVNLSGNCIASVVVAKWEGRFREESSPLDMEDDDGKAILPSHTNELH
ncbi:hypothetical protein H9P43_000441 [Blastocladiella emersonii ATCC 22665]|nr:hypothetical protein H9P43_000441 [Blastocladiella emersonii ATCC 22665]